VKLWDSFNTKVIAKRLQFSYEAFGNIYGTHQERNPHPMKPESRLGHIVEKHYDP
jgi:hypothetical protein